MSVDTPRVVFVSSHAQLGGAERILETLIRKLPPASVAGLISLQDGPFLARMADLTPVVLHTSGRRGEIARSIPRLRRTLRELEPDVVHANGIKAALMSGIAVKGTGIPVVWAKHDFSWDGALGQGVAALCTRVVGISESVTTAFRGRALRKVRVVRGAIDRSMPPNKPRRSLEEAAGRSLDGLKTIGIVGRLHPVKGHEDLIRALPAIRSEVPGAVCIVIGPEDPSAGGYRDDIVGIAREMRVTESVLWLGQRDDARDLMHGLDVGVVPSVSLGNIGRESLSLVALEYMDAGTPVVAYDEGGLPETLGACALLVPPRDTRALAEAIIEVLQQSAVRDRMIRCGRDRVGERFSVEAMVDGFLTQYREVATR